MLILIISLLAVFLVLPLPAQTKRKIKAELLLMTSPESKVTYHTVNIRGLDIFYREAGPRKAPVILLLHGFPSSSHMFRNLIPLLATKYRVVAPDYPGFGNSSMPPSAEFEYTFENLANIVEEFTGQLGIGKFSLYLMDYGAPIGFRLAVRSPERVQSLIIQNGNAYDEGLREYWSRLKSFWKDPSPADEQALRAALNIEATKLKYTYGTRRPDQINPDNWINDQYGLDRPGNKDIQLRLFYDYRTNVALYPKWQEYLRENQPPTLIMWGKNDKIFPAEGAEAYKRDLKNAEFHLLNTGHFALEEDCLQIANYMLRFLGRHVK